MRHIRVPGDLRVWSLAFPCCPGCPLPRVHGITALQYSRPTVGGAARPSPCSAPRKKEAGLPRGRPWLSRWPALIAPPRGHPATLSLQSHPHHCHHPADGKTAAPDAPRHGPAGCTPRAQAGGAPTPASECSRRGRGAQVTGAACRPNARPGRQLLTSPFRAGGRWGTPSSRRDRAHICCLPSAPVLPVAGKTGRWPSGPAGPLTALSVVTPDTGGSVSAPGVPKGRPAPDSPAVAAGGTRWCHFRCCAPREAMRARRA